MRRSAVLWPFAILWLGLAAVQEPRPARKPRGPQDPAKAESIPGRKRDPIEGVYRLRARTISGVPQADPGRGYVAITGRHLLLVLAGRGVDPDLPLLRAGVRTWKRLKGGFEMTVELGFFTDDEGGIHVEEPSRTEVRRVEFARGRLQVWQDDRSYLEFERLE